MRFQPAFLSLLSSRIFLFLLSATRPWLIQEQPFVCARKQIPAQANIVVLKTSWPSGETVTPISRSGLSSMLYLAARKTQACTKRATRGDIGDNTNPWASAHT